MEVEFITKKDLEEFRERMMMDIGKLLSAMISPPQKQWLKSREVRKMLGISETTLTKLRAENHLRVAKIGGIYFYKHADIEKMLEGKLPQKKNSL
ncbi:MAG TPA: helix-turn-helix domain-containing protein [Puia sp.]|jgi:hypothetical protein|nr:helix-turn-helix domain-containing protein [Puia sp.]